MFVNYAINRPLFSLCVSCAVFVLATVCTLGQDAKPNAPSSSTSKAPQIRFVSSSQAEVFAGPGQDFYPTSILKSGQSIEVHQETDDAWLAIAPPTGSFSWLPASQGLLLPGGRVVEVTEKSAVSWIGTSLGTAKQYRWQVKLERGQQLAVMGEQTIVDPVSGSKALWYKISPPPGEYRWIQAKATSLQTPPEMPDASASERLVASNASESEEAVSGQVVQASAQQSVEAGNVPRPQAKKRAGQAMPHQHGDRWAQWHAVEFKNGTFSFPGFARMMGVPPSDSAPASAGGDPFDLNASYTRPKSTMSGASRGAIAPTADRDVVEPLDTSELTTSQMAVRQSRGWRDPRLLREERMRGGIADDRSDEMALAANQSNIEDADVMDAGFDGEVEVGTGVVTAGAVESRRAQGSVMGAALAVNEQPLNQEQSWYGIDQAPGSQVARPVTMAQAGLEEVQLELSAMVAGPEQTWNLAPLAERARYFVEHGQDSLQRGQARLLLERIESFATIAQHSSALGIVATPSGAPGRPTTASSVATSTTRAATQASTTSGVVPASAASWVAPSASAAGSSLADNGGSRFDATGWLVPVHSSGRDMPTHALTNDAGRIIVYVTPAPGVNLTRFESQPIGVYGLRGYLPQLKSNHIQIQRVVRLQ